MTCACVCICVLHVDVCECLQRVPLLNSARNSAACPDILTSPLVSQCVWLTVHSNMLFRVCMCWKTSHGSFVADKPGCKGHNGAQHSLQSESYFHFVLLNVCLVNKNDSHQTTINREQNSVINGKKLPNECSWFEWM